MEGFGVHPNHLGQCGGVDFGADVMDQIGQHAQGHGSEDVKGRISLAKQQPSLHQGLQMRDEGLTDFGREDVSSGHEQFLQYGNGLDLFDPKCTFRDEAHSGGQILRSLITLAGRLSWCGLIRLANPREM